MKSNGIGMCLLLLLVCTWSYAQTLTIAISGDNPPFNSRIDQHNHFYGFDVELMDEICKRMEADCRYMAMSLSDMFVAIENNVVDLAIDSIIITSSRSQYYLFSQPYLNSQVRFMVRKNSSYQLPDDLKGRIIGMRKSNPFREFLMQFFKTDIKLRTFKLKSDVIEALSDGEIDAILVNNTAAEYWASNDSNHFRLLGKPLPFGNGFGIMANKDQAALISKINTILQQMKKDGFYKSIYTHYFSW